MADAGFELQIMSFGQPVLLLHMDAVFIAKKF